MVEEPPDFLGCVWLTWHLVWEEPAMPCSLDRIEDHARSVATSGPRISRCNADLSCRRGRDAAVEGSPFLHVRHSRREISQAAHRAALVWDEVVRQAMHLED